MFLLPTRQRYPRGGRTVNLSLDGDPRARMGSFSRLDQSPTPYTRPYPSSNRKRGEKEKREREREERKKSIAIRFTPRRRCLREPRPFRWPIEIRTSTQFSFLHIERKRNCSLLPNGKRKDNRRNFCCTVAGRTEGISRMRYVQFFDVTQSTQHLSKMQIYGAAASAGRGIIRRERKMENHRRP